MNIPFDSLCLACVISELGAYQGAKVQKVFATDPSTICIELYRNEVCYVEISWDAERPRITYRFSRPESIPATPFVTDLRRYLIPSRLESIEQVGFDRVALLTFVNPEEEVVLVAEIMGKHSNTMLVNRHKVICAAGKWVSSKMSRRVIRPGGPYERPPTRDQVSLTEASSTDSLDNVEGLSPFLRRLAEERGLDPIRQAFLERRFEPSVDSKGVPYPILRSSADQVVESYGPLASEYYGGESHDRTHDRERNNLVGMLKKTLRSKEKRLAELEAAEANGENAALDQDDGNLILAYQHQIKPGDTSLEVFDLQGNPKAITLVPELSALENAQRLFKKAKKGKSGLAHVREQRELLETDLTSLQSLLTLLGPECSDDDLAFCRTEATKRKFLNTQAAPIEKGKAAPRPYEGHSIRSLQSPGGWQILYGDNSTSNDYLTLRVAKPNDYWFHVRGGPSAHVVLQTLGKPEKVQKSDLEYAARVAARMSSSKHSSVVAVDYTLKKYVRRPKGSAVGLAAYTHEKTLHVSPDLN